MGKTHVEKAKLKDRLLQAQARAALEGLLPIVSAKWAAIDRNFAELDGYWYDLAMQLLMLMFYIIVGLSGRAPEVATLSPTIMYSTDLASIRIVTLCHSSPL